MRPPSYLLQRARAAGREDGDVAGGGDGKKSPPAANSPSNLSWMFGLCRQETGHLTLGVVGMSMASAMNLLFPRIMGKAIDVAAGKPPPGGLSKKGFLFVVLTTFVTGSVGSFLRVYSLGMVAERVAARLRKRLYRVLLAQEFNFYHHRKVGELVSRLSHDCQVTANAVVDIMANGFRSLNSAIGASCMLLTISPKLTLVSLSILPLVGSGAMIFSKFSSRLSKVHQNSIANMTGIVEERLNNIFTVKLFAAEQYEAQQFDNVNTTILKNASRAKRARGLFMGGLSLSINCSLFSVLYFGGSLVGSNELTIGSLTSFALYSGFMGLGFSQLSSCFSEIRRARDSSAVLFKLLETTPMPEEQHGPRGEMLDTVEGHIRFEDVSFSYPSREDIVVLDKLTLDIHPGEVVAIVGKSGAGKSTVASLITKILTPTSGKVTLDGVDIELLDTAWLRKQIGVVNQDPSLFASTIADNIMYGSVVRDEDRMLEAAKEAHAHDFVMELPEKYDTFVGEKGYELSGGQKQRIAIARALYKRTKILLFDEATSSLDGRSEDVIRRALDAASHNRTVFVIAHRLLTIKHANRIIVLDEGKIAETGTFEELNKEGTKFFSLVHNHAPIL
ncbi:hypothetical protein ATCC90586_003505 [Pythium insidiosum]|nr:hypothetical protein ATCC90586_003505 [Pythium insidiosum]